LKKIPHHAAKSFLKGNNRRFHGWAQIAEKVGIFSLELQLSLPLFSAEESEQEIE
jgi:hypothetical protein